MSVDCWQINLQQHFGGGEVYTRFLTQALTELGCRVHLVVSPKAQFWRSLDLCGAQLVEAEDIEAACAALPAQRSWVLTHGGQRTEVVERLARTHFLTGICHMPMVGNEPGPFAHYRLVVPVSSYVHNTLKTARIPHAYDTPLYGVASLDGRVARTEPIRAHSPYAWDKRKFRDRLLGRLYPLYAACKPERRFERRPGITLGLVSRLTPIKQFPQLFARLAPILARHPQFNLDIFGSGGYASVRDLRRALALIATQTRFWGHQADVASVYRQLDFLLTGLPEKEALGLNVIEAQACGLPVIAVNAPPFTETVLEGSTGFFFRDPREDDGADFERLLARIEAGEPRPDPRAAAAHLARFGYAAFRDRVRDLLACVEAGMEAGND